MTEYVVIYLLLGAFAGLLAGLFGVGGGLVIVPVLVYLFSAQGFDSGVLVHLAIGTSLATIIVTSLSSVYAHHKHAAVRWDIVRQLSPGIIIGALLGAVIADSMSSVYLRRFFALFEWLVGIQLLLNMKSRPSRVLPVGWILFLAGKIIGFVSSIVGIGGGTMTVPFLVWCNIKMRQAVATSSACGLPIAIAGAAGFVIMGQNAQAGINGSFGYLYLPAFAGIVVTSVLFAPLGARLAHRLPAALLKRIFGLFLIGLGSYMFLNA
ncbi:Uncharacterized UPF0721 integral membrane protein [hydrothermal vent metagenome]|uniref:Uncharacterized UPF0721 integral membrane protein n=1 Tax=hydrothermal vent metagenome TaxID=652676 RepID=A0A3B1AGS9_9ZZZZ